MRKQDDSSVRETFWSMACDMTTFLPFLLVSFSVLGLLSLFALLYVEPGTATYAIVQVDLALNVVAFVFIVLILRKCGQRRSQSR